MWRYLFQSFMLVRGYICLSQSHIHKAHDSSSGWLSLTYLPAQLSINLHVHCTYYHVMCHVSQWYFSLSLVVPSLTCLEIEKNLSQVLPTISSPSVILIILTRSHEMSFIFCGLRLPYILSVGTGEITGLFFVVILPHQHSGFWIKQSQCDCIADVFNLLHSSLTVQSINTNDPVPLAATCGHTMTSPPPCLTNDVICFSIQS